MDSNNILKTLIIDSSVFDDEEAWKVPIPTQGCILKGFC